MTTKTLDWAEIKAATKVEVTAPGVAVGAHEIEFYAIAFSSEPDKQGDIIDPGAADEWLQKFYAGGKDLPVSFHHAAMVGPGVSDPFSVIGYAPANAEHVWKDAHGIRVRAILETEINDKAAQVYRLAKRGILTGASAVFIVPSTGEERQNDGSTRITRIESIREAGPTLTPANEDAYMVAVKSERAKTPPWHVEPKDGGFCVVADETGATVKCHPSRAEADAHMRALYANVPDAKTAQFFVDSALSGDDDAVELVEIAGRVLVKAGRTISTKNEKLIRTAMSLLTEALAALGVDEAEVEAVKANADEPERAKVDEPNAWVHERLAAFQASIPA